MDGIGEFVGFFAAHALWCVEDGETLCTMVGHESLNGSRRLERIEGDLKESVSHGKEILALNPQSAARAVLVYDGFITLSDGKTDALIIEAMDYGSPHKGFTMAVPYRHANAAAGFAVFRPKFLGFEGIEPAWDALSEQFFRGVDSHENGAAVWNKNLDQSR